MLHIKKDIKASLLELYDKKGILLEGNIIKMIYRDDDIIFNEYLDLCLSTDQEKRRKRLEITKQVQLQNTELSILNEENQKIMVELQGTLNNVQISKDKIAEKNIELTKWKAENEKISKDLRKAINDSENARLIVEEDLDLLQKKIEYELINTIVRMALYIIISVGLITSALYMYAIFSDVETQNIGTTWSQMLGILLTNAFSIVGTIMGVKYSTNK